MPYSPDTYVNWMLLHNVDGCDCCLADTSEVGYCFQNARDCGVNYCNCGGVDNCEVSCLRIHRGAAPKATCIYLPGNHALLVQPVVGVP